MVQRMHLRDWDDGATACGAIMNKLTKLTDSPNKVTCKKCQRRFKAWRKTIVDNFRRDIQYARNLIQRDDFIQILDEELVKQVMDT